MKRSKKTGAVGGGVSKASQRVGRDLGCFASGVQASSPRGAANLRARGQSHATPLTPTRNTRQGKVGYLVSNKKKHVSQRLGKE